MGILVKGVLCANEKMRNLKNPMQEQVSEVKIASHQLSITFAEDNPKGVADTAVDLRGIMEPTFSVL